MRTAEVAARAGVNPQTLRYYERRGLLPTPPRAPSGYRAYDDTAVRVVRFVKRAQQLGFTLDEIESLLELAAGGPDACEAAQAVAQERRRDLDDKIESLVAMRDSLVRMLETCARPRAERECPLLMAIEDERDRTVPDGG